MTQNEIKCFSGFDATASIAENRQILQASIARCREAIEVIEQQCEPYVQHISACESALLQYEAAEQDIFVGSHVYHERTKRYGRIESFNQHHVTLLQLKSDGQVGVRRFNAQLSNLSLVKTGAVNNV